MRVGVIGTGRMGLPVLRRLCEKGHAVAGLARSGASATAVGQAGARVAHSVAETVDGAEAVIVALFDDAQVRAVCVDGELPAVLPAGADVVVHTTGSPSTAAAIAAAIEGEVVDAPFSGGPHDIAAGRVTLLAGGSDAAMARLAPVFAAYADPVLHVGPAGHGQRVKLVNNALFAANIGLLTDAARLGAALGVDEKTLWEALPHCSGTSRALQAVAMRGSAAAFADSVREFLRKDLGVVHHVADEFGGDLGTLGAAAGLAVPTP